MGSKGIRISALVIALIDIAAIIYASVVGKNSGFIVIISIIGALGCILLLASGFIFSVDGNSKRKDGNPAIFKVSIGLMAMYFIAISPVILFFVSFK